MGHQNIQFTGPTVDLEMDQQGHGHLHPEHSIVYGNVPNFPPPIHPVVHAPANQCNFSFQPVPERRGSAFFYGIPQLNGIPPQHSAINPDSSVTAPTPSGHYNPYLEPSSGSYGCSITYIDSMGGSFKRKNLEGAPGNFQYQNASAGSTSSVAQVTAMPLEPYITLMDSASFPHPGVIDPTPRVNSGSQRSMGNRPGMFGPTCIMTSNTNHVVRGNYVAPPVQLPRNPWLDMHFGANDGNISTFAQTQTLPYMHASVYGACVEAGNINLQGYQVAASNSSRGFTPPSLPQGQRNHHPPSPVQGMSGYNVSFPLQMATPSHTGINSFQDAVDPRPTFLVPAPQTGFPLYCPQHRGTVHGSSARNHTHPHLRVSSEDELASLDIHDYHEGGTYIDQHRDMRLDIDHMSYEELLALGEQIGNVGTGLSEEFIQKNLKIKTFESSLAALNLEGAIWLDEQVNFCVICQTGYKDEEHIGTLDCGHEYHSGCIKKWLVVKNSCPVCKSSALCRKAKDL